MLFIWLNIPESHSLILIVGGDILMSETQNAEKRDLEGLRAERNQLFERFLKNPWHTRLAIQIKAIDDQVADRTQQMMQKR